MKSTGELLEVDPGRIARDRAKIDEAWALLEAAAEAGELTDGQMRHVMACEPPEIDDENCPGIIVQVWAIMLGRWAKAPRTVTLDPDAMRTYPCRCGPGAGWVYEDPADGELVGRARPCPECNHRGYAKWLDHWCDPDHRCAECDGPPKYRTPADARKAEAEGARAAELEDLF